MRKVNKPTVESRSALLFAEPELHSGPDLPLPLYFNCSAQVFFGYLASTVFGVISSFACMRPARFLFLLAVALVFSGCSNSQQSFIRFNNPYKKGPLLGYDHLEDYGTGAQDPDVASLAGLPDPSPEPITATGTGTPSAPEIQAYKRGPAGSMCYTCRGKGYVLQPITLSTSEEHMCPACSGKGRN